MTQVEFFNMVDAEYRRARTTNPRFNSLHEAYAVLQEEVDEFWDQVKMKPHQRKHEDISKELVQIAAMALATVKEVLYI